MNASCYVTVSCLSNSTSMVIAKSYSQAIVIVSLGICAGLTVYRYKIYCTAIISSGSDTALQYQLVTKLVIERFCTMRKEFLLLLEVVTTHKRGVRLLIIASKMKLIFPLVLKTLAETPSKWQLCKILTTHLHSLQKQTTNLLIQLLHKITVGRIMIVCIFFIFK